MREEIRPTGGYYDFNVEAQSKVAATEQALIGMSQMHGHSWEETIRCPSI